MADDYDSRSKPELQELARSRGLDDGGNKPDLVARLREQDRSQETAAPPEAEDQQQDRQDEGQQPDAGGQAVQGDEGERVREVLAAHAHGEVLTSDRPADQSDAVVGLPSDDPRREAQTDAREAVEAARAGNQRVQEQFDAEQELGYRGLNPDPTPNRNYTFEGVAEGAPTPETDPDLAAQARATLFPGAGRFSMTREAVEERERRRQAREGSK